MAEKLRDPFIGTWKLVSYVAKPEDGSAAVHPRQGLLHPTTHRAAPAGPLLPRPPVGMSEREAHVRGVPFRVAKLPMRAVLRTRTTSANTGFMKALIGDDDRIVGFAMIGAEAGEVMAVVQTAMMAHLPYTTLRDAILTHPTMAEGLNLLFSNVPSETAGVRDCISPP